MIYERGMRMSAIRHGSVEKKPQLGYYRSARPAPHLSKCEPFSPPRLSALESSYLSPRLMRAGTWRALGAAFTFNYATLKHTRVPFKY